jgi:EPS-associated MarR family transcriptional regulator
MNEQPTIREDILNILRTLSSNGNFTQRQLSSHLGISLGKTNYLLKVSAKKGLIKIKNFTERKNKFKKVKYRLTQKGFEELLRLTVHFLQKKENEYSSLKKELEALRESQATAAV